MSFTNIDLRHMRHAATLGRLLSYTKAAKELGLTQSSLSRSIQAIEQRVHVRLFDRDRGGQVRVTKVGQWYLARANSLLREAEEIERMLLRSASAEFGDVKFGLAPLPARAIMPNILARNLSSRPDLRTRMTIRSPDVLLQQVHSEEIEFCLCPEQHIPPEDMRATVIGRFPISLLVRAGHPLLRGSKPEAGRYPLVLASEFVPTGRIPEFFRPLFATSPHIVIDDFGVLAQVTAHTDSVWLSSAFAAHEYVRRGLLEEVLLPGGSGLGWFRIVMYSLARRSLSPAAILMSKLFVEELRSLAAEFEAVGRGAIPPTGADASQRLG